MKKLRKLRKQFFRSLALVLDFYQPLKLNQRNATVVDKPVIQYLVEQAVAAGIEEIIFVTGRGKRAIEDHFDYSLNCKNFSGKNKLDLIKSSSD